MYYKIKYIKYVIEYLKMNNYKCYEIFINIINKQLLNNLYENNIPCDMVENLKLNNKINYICDMRSEYETVNNFMICSIVEYIFEAYYLSLGYNVYRNAAECDVYEKRNNHKLRNDSDLVLELNGVIYNLEIQLAMFSDYIPIKKLKAENLYESNNKSILLVLVNSDIPYFHKNYISEYIMRNNAGVPADTYNKAVKGFGGKDVYMNNNMKSYRFD